MSTVYLQRERIGVWMNHTKDTVTTPEVKFGERGSNNGETGVSFDTQNICLRLNDYREQCQMSVQALADASDVPFSTARRYLGGQVPNPQLNTVLAMAQALNMPVELLFTGVGEKPQPALQQLAEAYVQAVEAAKDRDERYQGIIKRLSVGILVLSIACVAFMGAWAYLDITNGDVGIFRYPEGAESGIVPWIVIGVIAALLLTILFVFIADGKIDKGERKNAKDEKKK